MMTSAARWFSHSRAPTVAAICAFTLPSLVGAQDRHVVGGGRVAGIAPAPPPVIVLQPGFGSGFQQFGGPIVGGVPLVILPDGRVFGHVPPTFSCPCFRPTRRRSSR